MNTLKKYLQSRHTEATTKSYMREINIYLSNNPDARTAHYHNLINYIAKMRSKYSSPAYIKTKLAAIKNYYQYLTYVGVRKDNPANAIHLRDRISKDIQLQDLFTRPELEKLIEYQSRYDEIQFKTQVILSLLIYQGLTTHEIIELEVKNINLDEETIFIKSTAKTNSRELALKPSQANLFYKYLNDERPKLQNKLNLPTERLILTKTGHPETGDGINYLTSRFKNLYPERNLNPRTIRMSVIANLLNDKKDLRLVQAFAGHKYPSSTEKYLQNNIETLKVEINKFHPMK